MRLNKKNKKHTKENIIYLDTNSNIHSKECKSSTCLNNYKRNYCSSNMQNCNSNYKNESSTCKPMKTHHYICSYDNLYAKKQLDNIKNFNSTDQNYDDKFSESTNKSIEQENILENHKPNFLQPINYHISYYTYPNICPNKCCKNYILEKYDEKINDTNIKNINEEKKLLKFVFCLYFIILFIILIGLMIINNNDF